MESTSPATDNSATSGVTEGSNGSFLDGLAADTVDGGKNPAPTSDQPGSEGAPKIQAAGDTVAPLAPTAQPGNRPAWMKQLPADLQAHDGLAKFPTIGEAAKAYMELEGRLGKSAVIPGKDASPEELATFFERLGRPKTPDQYTLTVDPEEAAKTNNLADFRQMAHQLGLTNAQAGELHKTLYGIGKHAQAQVEAQTLAARKDCEEVLRKEYGLKYEQRMEDVKLALKAKPSLVATLKRNEHANDPEIFMLLAERGKNYREAPLVEGSGSGSGSAGFTYPGM